VETLDAFVAAYGAEAGNLALRTMATGGVYVGGGIAPKILPALKAGGFLDAFRAKAPMDEFLKAVPVFVILNRAAGLLGAAVHARTLAEASPRSRTRLQDSSSSGCGRWRHRIEVPGRTPGRTTARA
jgi:hypothetical protein